MIHCAAPVTAQHARGVGIVDHHDGAVALSDLDQRGQRSDVAVHREHAVGDQQFVAARAVQALHDFRRLGRVLVRKDVNLGSRQPAAVDDAGVIQRVGDDVILRPQNRRNRPRVRREAGLKHHARFGMLERRDPPL
jgi:hypothetical protein